MQIHANSAEVYPTITVNCGPGECSTPRKQDHLVDCIPRHQSNAAVTPTVNAFKTINGAATHIRRQVESRRVGST